MSGRLIKNPLSLDPGLAQLLERARSHVMTREEREAQRKSWVIGELMLERPKMTREEAERLYEDNR